MKKVTLLLSLAASTGCLNDAPVAPTAKPASVADQALTLPPPQSVFLPPPPVEAEATYYASGVTVPSGMSAHMQISGFMNAEWNPQCGAVIGGATSYQLSYAGGNLGGNAMSGAGGIKWYAGSREDLASGFGPIEGTTTQGQAVWSPEISEMQGELTFRREPIGSGCRINGIAYPTWFFTGGQTVTVTFVTVEVRASKTSIQPNESVVFTASAVNFSPSAGEVHWYFYADASPGSPISVDACTGQLTCTYAPPARGRMSVYMSSSIGVVPGFSATISIIKCPTGDPLLDAGLTDELERTLQKSLAHPNKFEFKSGVWKDRTTGVLRFQELVSIANDPNGCWVATQLPTSTSTEDLVATFHAHPRRSGELIVCTIPGKPELPPVSGKVDYTSWAGGSPADWNTAVVLSAQEGRLIPTYVQDFNRIHRLNPVSADPSTWAANAQHWHRCTTPIGG